MKHKLKYIFIGLAVVLLIVMAIVVAYIRKDKQEESFKESLQGVEKVTPVVEIPEKEEKEEVKEEPEEQPKENEQDTEIAPEPTPSQPQATTPKVEAIPGQHRNPNSAVVVLDPGHQRYGDSTKEPIGPNSTETKARVTGGTTGQFTGIPEYQLNLNIAFQLKTELENRGYTVYMTRTSHDVNISNKERAEYATSVGADIAVRLHANGGPSNAHGAETLTPTTSNPYVSHLVNASYSLSQCVLNRYCEATGFYNRGVKGNDAMTGINWSSVPVTIIEMGFMSNQSDDYAMQDATMQNNMVQGIANGIDDYFGF